MRSKITEGASEYLFTAQVLKKYQVNYFRCKETGFIQTEDPYWLEEAYSSAIASLDIGLLMRNNKLSEEAEKIILHFFNQNAYFLDFAGGYGVFTRLMRDKGFNFFHTDKYCHNLFAKFFDLSDSIQDTHFEMLTAFEVFEHLVNPVEEIKEMLKYSNNILFSTEIIPNNLISNVEDWWYFIPETGQHISLYTKDSLTYLAKILDCNFYSNGTTLHLFTKNALASNPFEPPKRDKFFLRKIIKIAKKLTPPSIPSRETLLDRDWKYIKDIQSRN